MNKNRGRTIVLRVKDYPKDFARTISEKSQSSAGPYPSISGMRKYYWGKDALIVKFGSYIYYFGKDSGQDLPFSVR